MVFDVIRGYIHVATGLGDVTMQRAREVAEAIVSQSTDATVKGQDSVQSLTDELLEQTRTNRDILTGVVRSEVDRAVARLGFVREDELAAVRRHVHRLEEQLLEERDKVKEKAGAKADQGTTAARTAVDQAHKVVSGAAGRAKERAAGVAARAATSVSRTDSSKAGGQDAPAKEAAAKPSRAKKPSARKSTAKKPSVKKAAPKKPPAKKSAGRKPAAKKSAGRKTTGSKPTTESAPSAAKDEQR